MEERLPKDCQSKDKPEWAEVSELFSVLDYCLADMKLSEGKLWQKFVTRLYATLPAFHQHASTANQMTTSLGIKTACYLVFSSHSRERPTTAQTKHSRLCPTGLAATTFVPDVSPDAPGVRVPATASTIISTFPGPSSVAVASTRRQPGSAGKGAGSPEAQVFWTGPSIPWFERGGGINNSSEQSPSISPGPLASWDANTGSVIIID